MFFSVCDYITELSSPSLIQKVQKLSQFDCGRKLLHLSLIRQLPALPVAVDGKTAGAGADNQNSRQHHDGEGYIFFYSHCSEETLMTNIYIPGIPL